MGREAAEMADVVRRRLEVLLAPARQGITVTEACEQAGWSREWFYELRRRFEAEGIAGLNDRSRRPLSSPRRLAPALEERICDMRRCQRRWGPRRIRTELRRAGLSPVPAKSTIQRVLERNGLVVPRPRRRKAVRRFERPCPNDLWQIDGTEVILGNGRVVFVIDILDDHARFLVAAHASAKLNGAAAWAAFEGAFGTWGLPRQLLSDNGRCFSGALLNIVAAFERKLWALGVQTITSGPYHPETLGKIERHHATLKEFLDDEGPATSVPHLQELLDRYRLFYNEERPHQGIDDATPAERYHASEPATPQGPGAARHTTRKVWAGGKVRYVGWLIHIGAEWAGNEVEIIDTGDKIRVTAGDELLVAFAADTPKGYVASGRPRGRRSRVLSGMS